MQIVTKEKIRKREEYITIASDLMIHKKELIKASMH